MSDASELRYLATHEWGRIDEEGILTVGISEHAQDLLGDICLLYTSPSPRDATLSRMPSSA